MTSFYGTSRNVAVALAKGLEPVNWVVDFGSLHKRLEEIHPDTGLPRLIAPTKHRMEQALRGRCDGLTIIFRVDPSRGLMHAFRGPQAVVRAAQAALKRAP